MAFRFPLVFVLPRQIPTGKDVLKVNAGFALIFACILRYIFSFVGIYPWQGDVGCLWEIASAFGCPYLIRSNFIKTTYDISLDSWISFLPLGFSPTLKEKTENPKVRKEMESRTSSQIKSFSTKRFPKTRLFRGKRFS